ncbi:hypothetical protein [Hydrogenimonas sp.]|uniref:hypothetical protein n=1 Tax=Hydrogenimonas sp. TaxID=2231112 RepID=UPI0026250852|nr:hypothetical protein [Hydrogenimonas sp.]
MVKLAKIVPELHGKKVLFLGKTKTMSDEDIALFLDQTDAKKARDENDEPIALIVLGRLINPLEEAYSDRKYKEGVPVVDLRELESYYAGHIDPEALLGSLALFPNRERIINLLHNSAIGDDLFCEILRIYDWQGMGPFENDENRDVAGTLVARFYPEIEKNHNIQYSPVGPFLVAAQSGDEKLLEAMAEIPDYEITQRSSDPWMPRTLHESLLINPHLPAHLLDDFLARSDRRLAGFVAAHPNLPKSKQMGLVQRGEWWILEGAARNPNLSPALHEMLVQSENAAVRRTFLTFQTLDEKTIRSVLERGDEEELKALGSNERLDEATALWLGEEGNGTVQAALAANENLTPALYEMLERTKKQEVLRALAGNGVVAPEILERLIRVRDKAVYEALAANPAMPESHLRNFAKIKDRDIQKALASNPSTPIEILLGYQTDGELNQILKRNEAFGEYIKRNMGM